MTQLIDWKQERNVYDNIVSFLTSIGGKLLQFDMYPAFDINGYYSKILFFLDGKVKELELNLFQDGQIKVISSDPNIFNIQTFLEHSPDIEITPELQTLIGAPQSE